MLDVVPKSGTIEVVQRKEGNNMAYYWVRFQYEGETEKERFIEGMTNLKEFIQMVKNRGAVIKNIMKIILRM